MKWQEDLVCAIQQVIGVLDLVYIVISFGLYGARQTCPALISVYGNLKNTISMNQPVAVAVAVAASVVDDDQDQEQARVLSSKTLAMIYLTHFPKMLHVSSYVLPYSWEQNAFEDI